MTKISLGRQAVKNAKINNSKGVSKLVKTKKTNNLNIFSFLRTQFVFKLSSFE